MTRRFHVLGLPHTRTHKEFSACAYTQKVLNFCKMMRGLGHEVFHYGAEGSEVECTEHVTIITTAEQEALFGIYDWRKEGFRLDWNWDRPHWRLCSIRAAAAILQRLGYGPGGAAMPSGLPGGALVGTRDILALISGAQKTAADMLPGMKAIEYGVGYRGVFSQYCVWESYSHQANRYGEMKFDMDGRPDDAVIPNYFDPADFPEGKGDQGYCLFIGRLISRKGLDLAIEATRAAGHRLIIAGQGVRHWDATRGELHTTEGPVYQGAHISYVGCVGPESRAKLMGGALATFAPTRYVEPFGGVAVESQLCGTPAITSDWGAFPETVQHGVTGYRCRSLADFIAAAKAVSGMPRAGIRARALSRWSLDAVAPMYERYFDRIAQG